MSAFLHDLPSRDSLLENELTTGLPFPVLLTKFWAAKLKGSQPWIPLAQGKGLPRSERTAKATVILHPEADDTGPVPYDLKLDFQLCSSPWKSPWWINQTLPLTCFSLLYALFCCSLTWEGNALVHFSPVAAEGGNVAGFLFSVRDPLVLSLISLWIPRFPLKMSATELSVCSQATQGFFSFLWGIYNNSISG